MWLKTQHMNFNLIFGVHWCIPQLPHNSFKLASSPSRQLKSSKNPKQHRDFFFETHFFERTQKRFKRLFSDFVFCQISWNGGRQFHWRKGTQKKKTAGQSWPQIKPTYTLSKKKTRSRKWRKATSDSLSDLWHNCRSTTWNCEAWQVRWQHYFDSEAISLTWSARGWPLIELGVCQVNLTRYLCKHGADKHVCVVTGPVFQCYAETVSVFNL